MSNQNELEKLIRETHDTTKLICDRVVGIEHVVVIMAKRHSRLYEGWLEFRREVRGRLASIEALFLGKRR